MMTGRCRHPCDPDRIANITPCLRGSAGGQSSRQLKRRTRISIGTEESIPEEMDYAEIAVRMSVMNEVQFLFASKPCKPLKA